MNSQRIVSPYGEVLFIENPRNERIQSHINHEHVRVPFTIEADAVLPIVKNVSVENLFTIEILTGRTTGFDGSEAVIYQENGQRSCLLLQLDQPAEIDCPMPNRYTILENNRIILDFFHGGKSQTVKLLFEDGSTYRLEIVIRQALEKTIPQLEEGTSISSLLWETAEETLSFFDDRIIESEKPLDFSRFGQFSGYLGYESEFIA